MMNSAVPNVVRRDLQHAWHPLLAASYSGDVNNAATPHPARAGMSNSSVISPLIDLAVSTVGSPNPVEAGNNIRWTMVVVTNSGPDTVTGITISDPLPAGHTFRRPRRRARRLGEDHTRDDARRLHPAGDRLK